MKYSSFLRFLLGLGLVILAVGLFATTTDYVAKYLYEKSRPIPISKTSSMIDEDVLKGFTQDGNDIVYDRLADEIIVASKKSGEKYNIPPILILSVMQAESSFNLNAFSKEKAKGLMQINTAVWGDQLRKAGIISKDSDIYDPQNNIEAGCFILRQYIDETKDFEKAMNKYLGAYYKPYIDKIGRNVGDICMKNISKRIDATYKIK